MIAIGITLIVLISTLAFFYLKCSMMQSLAMLWSAVLSVIAAFSYYERVAELFISRGYGLQWAHLGSFLVLFIVGFAVLRTLSDLLIGVKIELGPPITQTTKVVCGFLTGFLFAGTALVAFGLLPMQGALFYSRFDPEAPIAINRPNKPMLNADGFVTGLYRVASSGSLRSDTSFGVLHADYLTQIHLNKLKVTDDVPPVCSREALVLPNGKNQKPVRLWDIPDVGQVIVVRAGIVARKIEDGGANDATGAFRFFPAQLRLVTKSDSTVPPLAGTGTAIYPEGFLENGIWAETDLTEVITPDPAQMKNRTYWLDVAFKVPSGDTPVLLQFRQNAVVELTPYTPVKTSPEIEAALDSDGQEAPAS